LPVGAHTPSEVLAAGQRIGPFVLLTPLGSGGSGRVWAAARVGQLGFTKLMALKVLRQDKLSSPRAHRRFECEARLGAQLIHPNVRLVHDLGMHEGRPYMAMRWVDTSLAELLKTIRGNKVQPDIACWLGLQCCAALGAAHGFVDRLGRVCPIIHRDVSPGNILLTAEGHVLLSDLAAVTDPTSPSDGSRQTNASRFFGNLRYAAPEALKEQALDGRADIFSLGCVLYEALSGAPPFDADDESSLMYQVLEQGAVDLAQRAPELPPALVATVRRALARDVGERFQSAETLAEALSGCIDQQSAFELEERAASVIQEVLGDKLRARKEAMYIAFQRFSVSQPERTGTLPIHPSPWQGQPSSAPNAAEIAAQPGGAGPRSDGVVASADARPQGPRVKGRTLLGVGGLVLGLSLLLGLCQRAWRDPVTLSSTASVPSSSTQALEPTVTLPISGEVAPSPTSRDPDDTTPREPDEPSGAGGAPSNGSVSPPPPAATPSKPPAKLRQIPRRGAAGASAATPTPTTAPRAAPSDAPAPASAPVIQPEPEFPALPPRIRKNPYPQPASGLGGASSD